MSDPPGNSHVAHSSSSEFSVAAHFTSGLVNGAKGDDESSESLSLSPPQVVVGSSLCSLAVHFFLAPLPLGLSQPFFPHRLAKAALCVFGFLLGVKRVAGVLSAAGSSPHHTEPTTALVTSGPFALSRNPGYIVLMLIPGAFAVASNSRWPLILGAPLTLTYLNTIVIPKEEELLARRFPEAWKSYSAKVRRWL